MDRRSELYFGLRDRDGALIADEAFEAFVADEVLRALPSGFTLLAAEGRWLSDGHDEREPSRVLVVLHHGEPAIDAALEHLRGRYRERFAQQSVLRADASTCVSR